MSNPSDVMGALPPGKGVTQPVVNKAGSQVGYRPVPGSTAPAFAQHVAQQAADPNAVAQQQQQPQQTQAAPPPQQQQQSVQPQPNQPYRPTGAYPAGAVIAVPPRQGPLGQPQPQQPQMQPPSQEHANQQPGEVGRVPLPSRRGQAIEEYAQFTSIDGNTYTFRKIDPNAMSDPVARASAIQLALLVTLTEMAKGGHPNTVLQAFKIGIKDADKTQFYNWKEADNYVQSFEHMPPDQILAQAGFIPDDADDGYEGPGMGPPDDGVSFDGA